MSKHDTILLTGIPGGEASKLGESLARELDSPLLSVEHVSLGDRIRAIGRGAVESLYGSHVARHLARRHPEDLIDDEIIRGVIEEVFDGHRETGLLLLDGYPRTIAQASDALGIARRSRRVVRGAIVTETDELTALTRMTEHSDRPATLETARSRLEIYHQAVPDAIEALGRRGLLLTHIDTTNEEADVLEAGRRAIATMTHLDLARIS